MDSNYVALFRKGRLVSVCTRSEVVRIVAESMIAEEPRSDDPILSAVSTGRIRALKQLLREDSST
jgi:hypothetical protein